MTQRACETQVPGAHLQLFCLSSPGWDLRISISEKVLGDADAASFRPHFENHHLMPTPVLSKVPPVYSQSHLPSVSRRVTVQPGFQSQSSIPGTSQTKKQRETVLLSQTSYLSGQTLGG